MLQGTVKLFSREKGWGFIVPDGGGTDVFVHARNLHGVEIANNMRVGFVAKETRKGRRATSVIVLTPDVGAGVTSADCQALRGV